jgi:SAM-dependent methyltransferase
MAVNPFVVPKLPFDEAINKESNIFQTKFGCLTVEQWEDVMLRSIHQNEIEGVTFPRYPDLELQARIHGSVATEASLREAFHFYRLVRSQYRLSSVNKDTFFLDFGSGWGRIALPFLRDFPLKNMFGFEPNLLYCTIARAHNPYIGFLTGDFVPKNTLPLEKFDLAVSWSIFSHLSESSARAWLVEIIASLKKDGMFVFTTWGDRFIEKLSRSQKKLKLGEQIQWYEKICIEAAGSLDHRKSQFERGDFVWFTNGKSTLYGEAFLSLKALQKMIETERLAVEVLSNDTSSLAQDVFVLRKL